MCFNISPCLYCLQAGLEKGFQNPDSSQSFSLGFNIQYSKFKIQYSRFLKHLTLDLTDHHRGEKE